MKNKMRFPLFIAISAVAFFYACSGSMDPSKLFVKKWQLESFKSKAYDDQMAMAQKAIDTTKDSATKAMMKQQLDMQTKAMEDMKKMTLTCNVDGTCEVSMSMMGQQNTTKGKWTLIDGGKRVVMTDEKSPKADTLNVDELTGSKMTVSGPDGKGGTVSMTYKSIQ